MLYAAWQQIARERNRDIALWDMNSGRAWRFCDLLKESETLHANEASWVFPEGNSVEFILELLRAWRDGKGVCPLEQGQNRPTISPPPSPCSHLKLTSATSGTLKMVAFTPEQLAADAFNIVSTMGLRPDWPNLGAISLSHSFGFSNLVLPLLLHGIPMVLAQSPLPEMLKAAAAGHSELTLAGVPALWRAWSEAKVLPRSIKLAISAGAPLGIELEQSVYSETGIKIHNFYGCSECGGIAYDASTTPRNGEAHVGQPMKNVALSIGHNGCLLISSRAVGETYWPNADATLGNGQFLGSDLAGIRNGNVYLTGRMGDQINIAGRKVSPETIESALKSHPQVKECLVFGVPDASSDRVDKIVACIVPNGAFESDSLKKHALNLLPAWQVPRDFWTVDSLQANSRGKLSRADWKAKYLSSREARSSDERSVSVPL